MNFSPLLRRRLQGAQQGGCVRFLGRLGRARLAKRRRGRNGQAGCLRYGSRRRHFTRQLREQQRVGGDTGWNLFRVKLTQQASGHFLETVNVMQQTGLWERGLLEALANRLGMLTSGQNAARGMNTDDVGQAGDSAGHGIVSLLQPGLCGGQGHRMPLPQHGDGFLRENAQFFEPGGAGVGEGGGQTSHGGLKVQKLRGLLQVEAFEGGAALLSGEGGGGVLLLLLELGEFAFEPGEVELGLAQGLEAGLQSERHAVLLSELGAGAPKAQTPTRLKFYIILRLLAGYVKRKINNFLIYSTRGEKAKYEIR